jgi:type IV secretion system protein VirD4
MKITPNIQAPRRSGALTLIPLMLFVLLTLVSFAYATQWTAAALNYQPRLGAGIANVHGVVLYKPWAIFAWMYWYSGYAPRIFTHAFLICVSGPLTGVLGIIAYTVIRARKAHVATTHGSACWGTDEELKEAGLLSLEGVILGLAADGRLIRENSKEHVACIAPTRSGKGVGQVIPTLLSWTGSVLVHDMKGENWEITSAWRATFSNVIYFNPTDPDCSAHFNPLLEARSDENQIRDVQNIADQLVDPHGRGKDSHWDRTADQFFLGAILHVLHAEPDKSLYGVAKFLSDPERDFEETLVYMKRHPHDEGLAHERIAAAAQAMLNKSEEERSGVLSTALGLLGLYSDPIVARNTSDSDFRIVDLMQAEHPVSLYIVVPDSDRLRLKPLTRLLMTMITKRLVEKLNPKENKHRLLMLVDEFPRLGKLPLFADALSFLAGYNIKVMLVMQSKSQLDSPDSFGVGNTIIESCKIRSLYTPQDPDTAQWISEALGPKTEVHQQTTYTGHRLAFWLGHIMVADQESARPLMDAAEVCKLPSADCILLVAGYPPFRVKRLRYYEHADFKARADLPPLELTSKAPYPFKPRPRPNPWTGRGPAVSMAATKKSPKPKTVDHLRERTEEDISPNELNLGGSALEGYELMGGLSPKAGISIDMEMDEEDLKRLRALDEMDRQEASHRAHRRSIRF